MHRRMFAALWAASAAAAASFSPSTSASASTSDEALAQLAWLQGCWAVDGAERGSGEQWMAPAGGSMLGMSRTVRNGRTTGYEFIRIARGADGKFAFIAQPSGQAQAIFPLVRQDGDSAVFENPAHDFPQRITYRRAGKTGLHARIEGKGKGIDFPMSRIACTPE